MFYHQYNCVFVCMFFLLSPGFFVIRSMEELRQQPMVARSTPRNGSSRVKYRSRHTHQKLRVRTQLLPIILSSNFVSIREKLYGFRYFFTYALDQNMTDLFWISLCTQSKLCTFILDLVNSKTAGSIQVRLKQLSEQYKEISE